MKPHHRTPGATVPLRITLLGPPSVEVDGQPLVVDTRKAIALLAFVAVVGRPIARDSLVELLWPNADPDGGRGALRRTLSVLRTGLGGSWLAVDRRQVALAGVGIDVDVRRFRASAGSDDRLALANAVAIYRGDFLEGFGLRDSATFDEWQALEAEALRAELARALRQLAMIETAAGNRTAAVGLARRLVALDPLDEEGHRLLMTLHARAGDRPAAVRQFRECVAILERELGVGPAPETRATYESIVSPRPTSSDPTVAPAGPPTDVLAAAAVLGDTVDPELVAGVLEGDVHHVVSELETLVRARILREPRERESPDRYVFADPTRRASVLGALGVARRAALRRRGAQVVAEAGRTARARGDLRSAARNLRLAVELGEDGDPDVYGTLGDVETLRGRYGEALAAYERGAALARPERVAAFEHRLGSLHLRRGSLDLAEMHLSAALARMPAGGDADRARVLAEQSLVAARRRDDAEAARRARLALEEADARGDATAAAQADNVLALLARRQEDLPSARRHLTRAIERAGVADDLSARVATMNNLALLERQAGNLEAALELTEEALRRCAVIGDRHREAALRNNRADLLRALGREREAGEELRRSVAAFAEVGEPGRLEPEIWKLVDW